jgi:hypothetical protein
MDEGPTALDPDGDLEKWRPIVDVTLVDAMLALSPEQRLLQNDRLLQTIKELRDGFAARRANDSPVQAGRGVD